MTSVLPPPSDRLPPPSEDRPVYVQYMWRRIWPYCVATYLAGFATPIIVAYVIT